MRELRTRGCKDLIVIEGRRKDTALFVLPLCELTQRYPQAKKIHVILDNDAIHTTKLEQKGLATPLGRRLRLHFLPPDSPTTTGSSGHGKTCTPT